MNNTQKIVALTTDPYDNIYGYSLVFLRLFDFLQKNYKNISVELYCNDGVSSRLVQNKMFRRIKMNPHTSLIGKVIRLVCIFTSVCFREPKSTIIIVNNEIPELIAGNILKLKFPKVYCLFQDDRIRNKSLFVIFVCKLRVVLLYGIKNIIFVNKYTMKNFSNKIRKIYIGNPVFISI